MSPKHLSYQHVCILEVAASKKLELRKEVWRSVRDKMQTLPFKNGAVVASDLNIEYYKASGKPQKGLFRLNP